jgi:RND family efflux transporter MFP subunit
MTRAIALVMLAASLAGVATAQEGGPPSAAVRVGLVEMRPVEQRASVTGEVRATQRSRVASREQGRVVAVKVREGDAVKQGDVLVTLDDSLLRIDLATARAQLAAAHAARAEAQAVLDRTRRDLSRLEELQRRQSATENEVQDARSAVDAQAARLAQREAEIEAAKARIAHIEEQIGDMTVVAPYNGRVTAKLVDEGEWAGQGDALVELITSDTVDIFLDVPQRYVTAIQSPETSIGVRVEALQLDLSLSGAKVVPVADSAARTFPVRLMANNAQGAIQPGMSVTASIPAGFNGPAMLAPADALLRDDAGWFVYTATDTGQGLAAIPARVEQLFRTGQWVAIRPISGPVFPGAAVVTEGNERILFPGQPLQVTNPDALKSAPSPPAQGGQGERRADERVAQ